MDITSSIVQPSASQELLDVQVGGVILNDSPALRVDSQPYGGLKDSGIQREGVKYAMEDMLETKVLVMRNVGVV